MSQLEFFGFARLTAPIQLAGTGAFNHSGLCPRSSAPATAEARPPACPHAPIRNATVPDCLVPPSTWDLPKTQGSQRSKAESAAYFISSGPSPATEGPPCIYQCQVGYDLGGSTSFSLTAVAGPNHTHAACVCLSSGGMAAGMRILPPLPAITRETSTHTSWGAWMMCVGPWLAWLAHGAFRSPSSTGNHHLLRPSPRLAATAGALKRRAIKNGGSWYGTSGSTGQVQHIRSVRYTWHPTDLRRYGGTVSSQLMIAGLIHGSERCPEVC